MPGTRPSQVKIPADVPSAPSRRSSARDVEGDDRHEAPGTAEPDVTAYVDLQEKLDRLSLDQALVDAEIANARVIDLTQRLLESRQEIGALQSSLERLQVEFRELKQEHEEMRSSYAFRLAAKVWMIRNALGL